MSYMPVFNVGDAIKYKCNVCTRRGSTTCQANDAIMNGRYRNMVVTHPSRQSAWVGVSYTSVRNVRHTDSFPSRCMIIDKERVNV